MALADVLEPLEEAAVALALGVSVIGEALARGAQRRAPEVAVDHTERDAGDEPRPGMGGVVELPEVTGERRQPVDEIGLDQGPRRGVEEEQHGRSVG